MEEALFCGHFGPIGVGAIFASILARKDLEAHYTEETPLPPPQRISLYQLLATIWPIVCFIVITSIIVHGSSVAVLTLGKRLNRMAITMLTTDQEGNGSGGWMQNSRNSTVPPPPSPYPGGYNGTNRKLQPETTGIKVRPTGGAKRKKNHKDDRTPQKRRSYN